MGLCPTAREGPLMTPTPHGRQFAQHPHARAIAHIDHPRLPQRMHSPRIPPVPTSGAGPPSFRCRVAITAYQNEGHTVEDQHLAHISPARFEHINPYSTYNLNVEAVLQRIRHRPLKPAQLIRRSTTRRFGTNDQPPPRRQHLRTPNPEPPATEGSSAAGEQPWTRFPSVSGQLRPQYVAAYVPRGGFRADIHQHPAPER